MPVIAVDPILAANVTSISQTAAGVLNSVIESYQRAGLNLPNRRYWTIGSPVVDCEQVVVSFIQAYLGLPGDEASSPVRCDSVKSCVLQVAVWRCVPMMNARGQAPAPEKMVISAEQLAADAYLLLDSAKGYEQWDPIGAGLGVVATVEAGQVEGEYQNVTLTLTLAVK